MSAEAQLRNTKRLMSSARFSYLYFNPSFNFIIELISLFHKSNIKSFVSSRKNKISIFKDLLFSIVVSLQKWLGLNASETLEMQANHFKLRLLELRSLSVVINFCSVLQDLSCFIFHSTFSFSFNSLLLLRLLLEFVGKYSHNL